MNSFIIRSFLKGNPYIVVVTTLYIVTFTSSYAIIMTNGILKKLFVPVRVGKEEVHWLLLKTANQKKVLYMI